MLQNKGFSKITAIAPKFGSLRRKIAKSFLRVSRIPMPSSRVPMSQSVSDIDSNESLLKFQSQRIVKCTLINLPIYRLINMQNRTKLLVLELRITTNRICKNPKRCEFGSAENPHDMKFTDEFDPAYRPRKATFIFPRPPNCRDSAESGDFNCKCSESVSVSESTRPNSPNSHLKT